ncbi:MAG: acetylornithine deacetylase [Nitrococcus sp.]|nr:acetylornithine deacetylase [Nitrococcus sp.]
MAVTMPSLRDMLSELIALPSVSSVDPALDQGNRAVIERLAQWLDSLGFTIDIRGLPGEPHKANLVATLGSGSEGLVLAGHTDTVPYDTARWSTDPFQLTERHGRLYGLGASDMKSFFALALEAIRELRARDLQRPLILLATADEESGMTGAKALVDDGRPLGRYALIGEPTGLRPVHLHKGVMMEALRLTGRSGHSSDPRFGVNALEAMTTALNEILAWRAELQRRYRDDRFLVPEPTLNLGHIHGGDNPNRICAEAELRFDLRPLPGMDLGALRAELRERLERALASSEATLEIRSLFPGLPPLETPESSLIIEVAQELTGAHSGAVAFGTEGPFFVALGMEVVVLGAGDIDQAHQPDEYVAVERMAPMIDLLQRFIRRFCLDPPAAGGAR